MTKFVIMAICHEIFAQKVTVNEKLCKNITLKLHTTYVLDNSENRLTGAILTNIQNICSLVNKTKTMSFLHIILTIKDSLQKQIQFNGNIFGNKCCRCNEGSLYY